MKTVYSDRHRAQDGRAELIDGQLLPCFEKPERADLVLDAVRDRRASARCSSPTAHGRAPLERVHTPAFLDFLEQAWDEWMAEHGDIDGLPLCWPTRALRRDRVPDAIDGKLSYYSFDAATPLTAGTWEAAIAARPTWPSPASTCCSAARPRRSRCAGRRATTRRPTLRRLLLPQQRGDRRPGAARRRRRARSRSSTSTTTTATAPRRSSRTAADVVFTSLHGDPRQEYPYFLGYEDEHGTGDGDGRHPQLPDAVGHRLRRVVRRARRGLPAGSAATAAEAVRRVARRRHLRGRPDLAVPAGHRRLPRGRRPHRRARAGPRCSCSRAATPPRRSA